MVSHHGVLTLVVSDKDVRFTSRVWKRFYDELDTKSHFSTTFHPQTNRKSDMTIQNLKDMLRAYVLDFGGS